MSPLAFAAPESPQLPPVDGAGIPASEPAEGPDQILLQSGKAYRAEQEASAHTLLPTELPPEARQQLQPILDMADAIEKGTDHLEPHDHTLFLGQRLDIYNGAETPQEAAICGRSTIISAEFRRSRERLKGKFLDAQNG